MPNKCLQVTVTGTVVEMSPCLFHKSYIMLSKISRLSLDGSFIRVKTVDEDLTYWIRYSQPKYAAKAYDEFSKFLEE